MANLNRYKFTFGKKTLTLTTEHDNLFMEEIAKVATEKYQAIKEQMPGADDETIALLLWSIVYLHNSTVRLNLMTRSKSC